MRGADIMGRENGKRKNKPGRRLYVILLAVCLMLAMMPLSVFAGASDGGAWADSVYILGRQVGSSNYNDVLGDGGSVRYDRESKTITLTNAVLDLANYDDSAFTENNYVCGISTWGEANIVLSGDNRIISAGTSFESDKEYVYGISAVNVLNISGSGTLDIGINTDAASIKKFYGIDSTRQLNVDGSSLSVSMTGAGESYGIYSGWRGISLTNNAVVSAVSSGGSNRAVCDTSYKKLNVEYGSCLEMVSDYAAFEFSRLPDSIIEGSILVNREATSEGAAEWDKTTRLNSYKYVAILGNEAGEGRASSGVYILGRKLEDGELPASVPHSGKIEYDPDTATLTLTDASIDLDDFELGSVGNITVGIYALSDVNIVLSGSNTIKAGANDYSKGTEYVSGIEGWGKVNISGGSGDSLSVALAGNNSSNKKISFTGISADDSVTVNNVTLNVNMGEYGKCTGIYAWKPIYLNSGAVVKVNADGSGSMGVSGVNSIGNSEINDDSVLEMSSDGSAFYCWTPGASLKAADALVGDKKDGSDAFEWDKKSRLYEYKYVRFTGPDAGGGGERFGDDVRVLGRKIEESNCNDVLGDGGSVKFDFDTNTLTLTNADLDLKDFHHEYDDDPNPDSGTNVVRGIDADRDITIVLSGRNTIHSTVQSYDAKKKYVRGIDSGSRNIITLTGKGSLEIDLDKNNEALSYEGIDVGGGFTVDGVSLTVSMGGSLAGTGIDCMMSDLILKNGASVRVSAEGENSTAVDYMMASGMSMDESSLFEAISDGTAFDCWMLSDSVKELGALVNDKPTAEGAAAWDKKTILSNYKYVRFPEVYTHTHTISHVERKEATCEEDGYEEYWVCSGCGLMFSDASGADDKIIDAPTVIPATGHHTWDSGKITKKATLLTKGEKTFTCTVCGATKTEEVSFKESVKETVKEAAEKVKEWLKKIFGGDEPDAVIRAEMEMTLTETSFTYNGSVQKPAVASVKVNGTALEPGDYKVIYSNDNSTDAGAYTVTVSVDGGSFLISKDASYTIEAAKIDSVSLDKTEFTYNGSVQKPGAVSAGAGAVILGQDDFDIDFQDEESVDAGIYRVTVIAKGKNFCGSEKAEYRISPAEITAVNVSKTAFTYNGKVQKPGIVSVMAGELRLPSTEYALEYSDSQSKTVGKYSLTVTGRGNYSGSQTVTYSIAKAANTLKLKGKTATVKYKKLKKKNQKLAAAKVITFTNKGQGAKTYTKTKGNKKISINKKTGQVTVKKGLKKGKYKVTVKVKAAGNANYKASAAKKVTFTIRVK